MKFSILAFALFSTTVFAIGTNEVTGSFESFDKVPTVEVDDRYLTGASHVELSDNSRMPASVAEKQGEVSSVNEVTGSFE